MTTIPETGIVFGLDDPVYRQAPGLSSTGVKLMLDSPAKYRWATDHPAEPKTAFDLGHAVHAEVLGEGLPVEIVQTTAKDGTRSDAETYQTKSAQAHREEIRAAGRVPLLRDQHDSVIGMRDAVFAHDDARTLLEAPGDSEVSCFWDDPYTGAALKGRLDRLASDTPVIVDLKSTALSARPSSLRSYAARYGWGEQACHYRDGAWTVTGDEHRFIHVACEVQPPHLVSVVELDADFLAIAEERRRYAIDLYAQCLEAGDWPGYGKGLHRVSPPRWYGLDDLEDPA